MKKKIISTVSTLCAAIGLFSLSACAGGNATALGTPAAATSLSYSERSDEGLAIIKSSAEQFASEFAAEAYKTMGGSGNFAVSPVSVYMGLSIAAECAADETRSEICSALNIEYDTLKAEFNKLYSSLIAEYKSGLGSNNGRLSLTNSIWLNDGNGTLKVKDECISSLADNFYCYSYSADFTNQNAKANKALKRFVKDQTYGLINKDFNISNEASFVLLNTLYLKDIWNAYGDNLPFTSENYEFVGSNGDVKSQKLLQGYYSIGRVYEDETFTHYFAQTYHGYKVKFILPKAGYTVADVFTSENIAKVNALTDYNALDEENLLRYNTRCLFPEFSASFDDDLKSLLESSFGIRSMFDSEKSNFSSLSDMPNYCTEVRHATELTVNKKGIEGASVIVIPGAGAAGPDEYQDVYVDFVVDGAFGFILTDWYDTTVFSGVVNSI